MVEVTLWQMAMDEKARIPVVILREKNGNGKLPIWIGAAEAQAIAFEMQGKEFQRPMTHDLTMTMLCACGAQLRKIEIAALRDSTYFAKIILQRDHELISVDARPSDSIALAVRAKAPIFAAKELLAYDLDDVLPDGPDSPALGESTLSPEERAERLRQRIRDMNPEDFGRFSF